MLKKPLNSDILIMNAWSLLYEELDMNKNIKEGDSQDFWKEDGYSLVGNPYITSSPDTIDFSSTVIGGGLPGGLGTDTISVQGAQQVPYGSYGSDTISFETPVSIPDFQTTKTRWKYDEEKILSELSDYISGTYNQHYSAGTDKVQTLDLIEACGDGESFCRSNILKYASRYDKKGTARRDIMKILHYAVLLLHFNDKNAQREIYPQ